MEWKLDKKSNVKSVYYLDGVNSEEDEYIFIGKYSEFIS